MTAAFVGLLIAGLTAALREPWPAVVIAGIFAAGAVVPVAHRLIG
ncbi:MULTISPECIES: hypothetical protein [unclassified Streptomyces]